MVSLLFGLHAPFHATIGAPVNEHSWSESRKTCCNSRLVLGNGHHPGDPRPGQRANLRHCGGKNSFDFG